MIPVGMQQLNDGDVDCARCGMELRCIILAREPDATAVYWCCPCCSPALLSMLESWPMRSLPGQASEARSPYRWRRVPDTSAPEQLIERGSGGPRMRPFEWLTLTVVVLAATALLVSNLTPLGPWLRAR